jgi:hypothetical protein
MRTYRRLNVYGRAGQLVHTMSSPNDEDYLVHFAAPKSVRRIEVRLIRPERALPASAGWLIESGLERKAELWERRLTSGHGALQVEGFAARYEPLVFMLAGPIKHWWDANWMTAEHVRYDEWRTKVSERLVVEGHLVYRPHEAFKGHWSETAQAINDAVIAACDVFIDLTPPGVPGEGTVAERALAVRQKKRIIELPPPDWRQLGDAKDDAVLNDLCASLA